MKKIILLILALLFCSPCFAQTSTDNFYEISDFSGLLKNHISPYLTPKNSAYVANDVRGNVEFGALAKRDKRSIIGSCASYPVKSIYRFYKSDDNKYTIAAYNTSLYLVDDTTNVCTEISQGLSDGRRWSWITYKDKAIGMNGGDIPVKWDGQTTTTSNTDGSRTAGNLFAELGAPFAELNTGANLDASSWYQYKIAYSDGTLYYFSQARSNPILTGSSVRDVYLIDIPLGPSGTTQRIIYRTVGNTSRANVLADTSYYRVTTINDNTTTVYADAIDDATILANTAPTWTTVSAGTEVTPPKTRFGIVHDERLFTANNPSEDDSGRSTIYWSDVLNPDYFNVSQDFELIRPDDGDQITFLKHDNRILAIGKNRSIQHFYTDNSSSSSWSISNPLTSIGCDAPYSAVETNSGIIYLNRFGLYNFYGQTPEFISDSVTPVIADILETSLEDVVSVFHNKQYMMAYTSSDSGDSKNNRVLLLDTVRDSYVLDNVYVDSWASFNSSDDPGVLAAGSSDNTGDIYSQTAAFSSLIYRTKTRLNDGTTDSVIVAGTENDPYLELGWGISLDSVTLAGITLDSAAYSSAIVDRPSTVGYWYSDANQINATAFDKLYWNEELGATGNVTFAIRTATDDTVTLDTTSWSSEFSSPNGSDISSVTANNYIQIRATLTTSDIVFTPQVFLENSFVIKLTYQKTGLQTEDEINSYWESGFTDFGVGEAPKRIKEVQVYYTGDEGELTIGFEDEQQVSTNEFTIDLSTLPNDSTSDAYYGNSQEKIYVYFPSITDQPIGRKWRFYIQDSGVEEWKVRKIVVRYDNNEYVTFQ